MPAQLPMLAIEQLRQAALARLRGAVAAANANDPTAQPALAGVYIPGHRFEKLRPEKAPFIHVAAKSDGGAGDSRQLAQIDLVGTLHVNLFIAGKRGSAPDLDPQAAQIAQAIALVLLEDSTFLELFAWVSGLRFTIDDGVARGDDQSEFDCVLVQIELEMSIGQERFEPQAPNPLTTIFTEGKLGDDAQSIPAQSLVVKQDVEFPP
jgi:hypothetical protein